MISVDILKARKLTKERLKDIFTATDPRSNAPKDATEGTGGINVAESAEDVALAADPSSAIAAFPEKPTNWDIRTFFENRIRRRVSEGQQRAITWHRFNSAIDLAMDTPVISRMHLPLAMLAEGYIDVKRCYEEVSGLSQEWSNAIFEKQNDVPVKVSIPKLWEISHNLVHSLVTRRVAAVATPIAQRFPFVKYDSRSTSLTGQLKADLMTQYAEAMSDNYDYRHGVVQTVRDVSMYTHQVEFIRSAWEKETQLLRVPREKDSTTGVGAADTDFEDKEVIVKEGLDFVAPHPSRVYWDSAYPLAKINPDTGPTWIGYWDIARIGDLRDNDAFFNKGAIMYDTALDEFVSGNRSYFDLYYKDRIALAPAKDETPDRANDRVAQAGQYAQNADDRSITLAYHFEKINPKRWGIADYDHDIWIRFVATGTGVVVYAEPLACTPACCSHYNENDSREHSISFAAQVLPYQDQISNLLSQLLEVQQQGLTKIFALNIDDMDPKDVKDVEDSIHGRKWYAAKNIIIKYSAAKMADRGEDPRSQYADRLKAIEISTTEKTSEIIKSIVQVISMAERLLFFSPQELGQVAPREISATEANIVNSTTLGIRDFHSLGIEEGLDAKKRMIYEASMAYGSDTFELPAFKSYSAEIIQSAGFTVTGVDREGNPKTMPLGYFTVTGNKNALVHNYVFTSRDGTERTPSAAVAQATVQFMDVLGKYPALQQAVKVSDAVELLNEVSRALGVPVKLKMPEGGDPNQSLAGSISEQQQLRQGVEMLAKSIDETQKAVQQQQADMQALTKSVGDIAALLGGKQTVPTRKGQIAPGYPAAAGAPPMTTQQPEPVPYGGP